MTPVAPRDRIAAIDALRGLALLGIVVVNYSSTSMGAFRSGGAAVDRFSEWVVETFANGFFYPIFAFLFGMGMALQCDRVGRVSAVMLRRILILAGIGLLHAAFIWSGDILRTYAVVGLLMLALSRSKDNIFVTVAILALAGASLYRAIPHEVSTVTSVLSDADEPSLLPYSALVLRRLQETPHQAAGLASILQIFAIMVVGFLAGRHNILTRRMKMSSLAGYLSAAVLLCIGAHAAVALIGAVSPGMLWQATFATAFKFLYHVAQSSVYVICILLMLKSALGTILTRPLADIGRMALTNYLLQSVIGVLLFYASGLGLSGRIGFTEGVLIAVSVYCTQAVLSRLWLKRFRFGPMEWLWRSLTYGQAQSMALAGAGPVRGATASS